jgi:hypothetical protein
MTLDFAWELLTTNKLRFGDPLQIEAHRTLLDFRVCNGCSCQDMMDVIAREMTHNNPERAPMLLRLDDGSYRLNILQ